MSSSSGKNLASSPVSTTVQVAFDRQISDSAETISLKTALISVASIVAVVGLVVAGALFANQHRRKTVVAQYTQETNQLMSAHQAEAKDLFTQTFDDCQKTLGQTRQLQPVNQQTDVVDCPAAVSQLAKLGVDQLKDASAIAYVRVKGNSSYELLEASGEYNQIRSLDNYSGHYGRFTYDSAIRADLEKYLQHQQPILMWQDFIPYIGDKEVIVPVIVDGQTIGYIFRGVIER